VLDRFKAAYGRMLGRVDDEEPTFSSDDEHEAVLELLVATMFADANVTEAELDEIDAYGQDHGWNTPAFSFGQALGSATAKVRDAREAPDGTAALLAALSTRITTPGLRAEVPDACQLVASADGATVPAESAWLAQVEATFTA